MNGWGSRILFFMFCNCWLFFWLICCKWVWIILMDSVLVSFCSHGRVCERIVSILDCVIPCELLSRLTSRGSWRRLMLSLGHGSAFWQDDKRPCTIQQELSAAPVLLGITCLSCVHLCAHWKIFNSGSNFAWWKMWVFCIVTGRCCSEVCKFVWLRVVVILFDNMGLERTLWLGFETVVKCCIIARVIHYIVGP